MNIVINALATAPGGGLTHLLGILEGFRQIGFVANVSIVTSYPDTVGALRDRGWDPIETNVRGFLSRAVWESKSLRRLCGERRRSILYSSNFAAVGVRCPQVVYHQSAHSLAPFSEITDPERRLRFALQKIAARISLRLADANLFVTEYLRSRAERIAPGVAEQFVVIPYGLGEAFQRLSYEREHSRPLTYRLAAIQAPLHNKDNETLLQSFKRTVELRPDLPWSLEIAGSLDWSRWQARAQELGISDRVTWRGFLNEQEIIDLLSGSDALIFTSILESFGLPLIEAMACGCPVVAVASTAIPEISAGAAFLVPSRSPEKVADAVLLLSQNQEFRHTLIKRGLERALDFSWVKAAKHHVEIFERVLAAKKG